MPIVVGGPWERDGLGGRGVAWERWRDGTYEDWNNGDEVTLGDALHAPKDWQPTPDMIPKGCRWLAGRRLDMSGNANSKPTYRGAPCTHCGGDGGGHVTHPCEKCGARRWRGRMPMSEEEMGKTKCPYPADPGL